MSEKLLTENMLQPFGTTLSVAVDGFKGKCTMGSFGAYSTRISFSFESEHPELRKEFITKHFHFEEPGVVSWGHDGKSIKVTVFDEENPFNKDAAANPFGN